MTSMKITLNILQSLFLTLVQEIKHRNLLIELKLAFKSNIGSFYLIFKLIFRYTIFHSCKSLNKIHFKSFLNKRKKIMYNFAKYIYYSLPYFINLYLVLVMILIVLCTILVFILLHFRFKHYIFKILARSKISGYPFKNILDRFLPLVTLFVPLISVLRGFSDILWIHRLGLLILFHIVVVIPIIFFWSTVRRWDNEIENFAAYKSWALT
jgi:hypothetical protein